MREPPTAVSVLAHNVTSRASHPSLRNSEQRKSSGRCNCCPVSGHRTSHASAHLSNVTARQLAQRKTNPDVLPSLAQIAASPQRNTIPSAFSASIQQTAIPTCTLALTSNILGTLVDNTASIHSTPPSLHIPQAVFPSRSIDRAALRVLRKSLLRISFTAFADCRSLLP